MKKISRQGLRATPKELISLGKELIKEGEELEKNLSLKYRKQDIAKRKWQLNIINKNPGCSDTWEFEK